MKTFFKSWIVQGLALALAASVAFAQDRAPFRQEELDQLLAPVALYPDPLLSQVLMASTYPLEVVQASRWSRANPGLEGEDAVAAAGQMDWDPSVKALVAFPQVLAMMDENIEWMERLGEAFLAQQAEVMDTVQGLRRRAEAAGNLRSTEQMRVARQGDFIYLEPPAPETVYVPFYNPVVVYGPWWWPAFRPFFWAPPRAHYAVPAHRPAFLWGSRIVVSNSFFFARPDWQRRQVTVNRHQGAVNRATVVHRPEARPAWEHNPARRAAPVRNTETRQRFEQSRNAGTAVQQAAPSPAPAVRQRQPETRQRFEQSRAVATPAQQAVPSPAPAVRQRQPETRQRFEQSRAAATPAQRAMPSSAPDARPRWSEERRSTAQERRRPEPLRAAPNISGNSNRPSVNRDAERVRPVSRPEARSLQPEPRSQVRAQPTGAPRAERRETPRAVPRAENNQRRNDRGPRGKDS